MRVVICRLVLLYAHCPQALDALLLPVVVALVRVDFGNTESEQGEREQLERVFCAGAVGDGWEFGVLGTGFFVRVGLQDANGAFDYDSRQLKLSIGAMTSKRLTPKHVFALFVEETCPALEVLVAEKVGYSKRFRCGRTRLDRLSLLRWPSTLLLGLLLRLLLHHLLLVLAHCLRLELLDVLRDSHAMLLSLGGELALHKGNLLGSWLLAWTKPWRRLRCSNWRTLAGLALGRRSGHVDDGLVSRKPLSWEGERRGG